MLRYALILTLLMFGAVACSSKQKKQEAPGAEAAASDTANDATIANKELNFDATGSDSGNIQGLHSVNFEYDKANLTDDAKKKLAQNAAWIKANAGVVVQVEGHCDERGSIEYNLALGERRAKAAKAYMVGLGIEGKRLSVISYGKEKPISSGDSESAMAKNRRANFVPLPK